MDIEHLTQSVFSPISPSFFAQILKDPIIVEGLFTENLKSQYNIILTLTKKHIIAKNSQLNNSDKIYVAEVNFDIKFETIYLEEVTFCSIQKNVHSKKIGIKILTSNT